MESRQCACGGAPRLSEARQERQSSCDGGGALPPDTVEGEAQLRQARRRVQSVRQRRRTGVAWGWAERGCVASSPRLLRVFHIRTQDPPGVAFSPWLRRALSPVAACWSARSNSTTLPLFHSLPLYHSTNLFLYSSTPLPLYSGARRVRWLRVAARAVRGRRAVPGRARWRRRRPPCVGRECHAGVTIGSRRVRGRRWEVSPARYS